MRSFVTRNTPRAAVLALGLALSASAPVTADAQPTGIAGRTRGCFGPTAASCDEASEFSLNSNFRGLSFTGVGPNSDTNGQFFGAFGPLQGIDLGSFSLASNPGNFGNAQNGDCPQGNCFDGMSFYLRVLFERPNTSDRFFTATLNGTFTSDAEGNVAIDFVNTPQTFTFATNDGTGSFDLTVNDPQGPVAIPNQPGNNVNANRALRGDITNVRFTPTTTVPEPGTYALMAAGLAALGVVARRRRV